MKTIAEIQKLLKSEDIGEFEDTVIKYLAKLNEEAEDEITLVTFAAALLKGSAKDDWKKERVSFSAKPGVKYQRFFINLGEKDRASKSDIMDFIISHVDGLTRDDFADVYTLDVFSFFEAPLDFAPTIVEKVNGVEFKGREVHVELSEKKDRKPGGRSFGGDRGRSSRGSDRGDRGSRSFGSRDQGDRGNRSYGSRDQGDRGGRSFDRSSDRGERSSERRSSGFDRDRAPREDSGERRRSFDSSSRFGDRPKRSEDGARSFGRDDNRFGSREEAPARRRSSFSSNRGDSDRSYAPREEGRSRSRSQDTPSGERSYARKPRAAQEDKPRDSYFNKSYESNQDSPKARFLKNMKNRD